jgi:Fe-S cluster assembly iron-binding protein IscA
MLKITPKAKQLIRDHFKTAEMSPIRILVKMGGCGIRSLGVALEQPTAADAVFRVDGFDYVIDRQLLRRIEPVTVDSDGICFRLSGNGIHPPTGCGTCPYLCGAKGGKRCVGICAVCEDPCATGLRRRAARKRPRLIKHPGNQNA